MPRFLDLLLFRLPAIILTTGHTVSAALAGVGPLVLIRIPGHTCSPFWGLNRALRPGLRSFPPSARLRKWRSSLGVSPHAWRAKPESNRHPPAVLRVCFQSTFRPYILSLRETQRRGNLQLVMSGPPTAPPGEGLFSCSGRQELHPPSVAKRVEDTLRAWAGRENGSQKPNAAHERKAIEETLLGPRWDAAYYATRLRGVRPLRNALVCCDLRITRTYTVPGTLC